MSRRQSIVRAVIIGPIWWSCPYCGQVNKTRLGWRTHTGQCKGPGCRRKLVFGLRLQPTAQGARTDKGAPDWPAQSADLIDAFREAEFDPDPWHGGDCVHRP